MSNTAGAITTVYAAVMAILLCNSHLVNTLGHRHILKVVGHSHLGILMRFNLPFTAILFVASAYCTVASCPVPLSRGTVSFSTTTHDSALVDLNHDGRLDIVTAGFQSNNISIRLAVLPPSPIGTFQLPVSYPVGTSPGSLASGDFNNDGNTDVATGNFSTPSVSVLLGNSTGTFAPAVDYQVDDDARDILAHDLNNDGSLDLVVATRAAGIAILLGNPNGSFESATAVPAPELQSIDVADFNTDGIIDLVVGEAMAGRIGVLLGLQGGSFGDFVEYETGLGSVAVAAGDVNGDGRTDAVTANYLSNDISVLIANPDGSLQPRINYLSVSRGPIAISLVDLNSDNRLDVVTAGFTGNLMSVFRNTGSGAFLTPELFLAGTNPRGVATGDVNNDGTPDISIALQSGGVALFLNRFCAADFNCDGTSDFFDYLDFVDRFANNDPSADYNVDGIVDLFDYLDFVQDFQILCP